MALGIAALIIRALALWRLLYFDVRQLLILFWVFSSDTYA
jgi:hypothetical protein